MLCLILVSERSPDKAPCGIMGIYLDGLFAEDDHGNLKNIALELGGENPNIIFADAGLYCAVDNALNGIFFHVGKICSAGSRLMIKVSIHDTFVARLKARMATSISHRLLGGYKQSGLG